MSEKKTITIYDIAEKAGVSIATVSRVFNDSSRVAEKTKKRVMDVATSLGYHPQAFAQGLASQKKNTIMAVVPVISNYFFMEVLAGIQDQLSKLNFDLYIYNVTTGNVLQQVEHVLKRRWAEGYLFVSIHLQDDQWKTLNKYKAPITLIDEHFSGFDSVSVDSIEGSYTGTKYLLDKGYKRIAMISAVKSSKPVRDRILGYKRALEEDGRMVDDSLIVSGDSTYRDGFTEKAGYEAMIKLLKRAITPDACFCASDIQAIGAIKAMQDMGHRIPIISYDNIEIAEYVGLSTMCQPMYDMGKLATQKLLDRLDNPLKPVSHTVFSPDIIIRQSSEAGPGQSSVSISKTKSGS